MGMYDTVGNNGSQIKIFKNSAKHYSIGSKINILDGLYITYEGWFVVKDGIVLTEGILSFDKYGNIITPKIQNVLDSNNEFLKVVENIEKKFKLSENN